MAYRGPASDLRHRVWRPEKVYERFMGNMAEAKWVFVESVLKLDRSMFVSSFDRALDIYHGVLYLVTSRYCQKNETRFISASSRSPPCPSPKLRSFSSAGLDCEVHIYLVLP